MKFLPRSFALVSIGFNVFVNVLNFIMLVMETLAIAIALRPKVLSDFTYLFVDLGLLTCVTCMFVFVGRKNPNFAIFAVAAQFYSFLWTLLVILNYGPTSLYFHSLLMWGLVWCKFFVSSVVLLVSSIGSTLIFCVSICRAKPPPDYQTLNSVECDDQTL